MILRWSARLLSVASTALLMLFMFGGGEHINFTLKEFIAILFFPFGVIVGFAIAWFRPTLGGWISLASLGVFYLFLYLSSGTFPGGPYFLAFAVPSLLYLWSGNKAKDHGRHLTRPAS